jgi:hypothetical protein
MTQREEVLRRHIATRHVVDIDAGQMGQTVVDEYEWNIESPDAREALFGNSK